MNALQFAAMGGDPETLKLLAAKGLPVDPEDAAEHAALYYAAYFGQLDAVRTLLGLGANAARSIPGTNWSAIRAASTNGHADVVGELLRAGAPADEPNKDGTTPLMIAASRGHLEAARLLVKAGADPARKDAKGRTALDLAKAGKHAEVVAWLAGLAK